MKTVLISGCCGFIGQNLVSKLSRDCNIIGIDNAKVRVDINCETVAKYLFTLSSPPCCFTIKGRGNNVSKYKYRHTK